MLSKNITAKRFLIVCLSLIIVFNGSFYFIRENEKIQLANENQILGEIKNKIANNRHNEAIELLDNYFTGGEYGNNDAILFLSGRAHFGKRDYLTALTYFEKARTLHPLMLRNYDYLYYYGLSLYATGEYAQAVKVLRAALLVGPQDFRNAELQKIIQEIK